MMANGEDDNFVAPNRIQYRERKTQDRLLPDSIAIRRVTVRSIEDFGIGRFYRVDKTYGGKG